MCLVSRWFQCWSGVMIADALCKGRMGTGKGTAEPLGKRVDGTGFILRVGGQALVALGFALKDICFTLKPAAKASDLPVIVAAIRIEAYCPRASLASSATLTPRIGRSKAVAELCPHCYRREGLPHRDNQERRACHARRAPRRHLGALRLVL